MLATRTFSAFRTSEGSLQITPYITLCNNEAAIKEGHLVWYWTTTMLDIENSSPAFAVLWTLRKMFGRRDLRTLSVTCIMLGLALPLFRTNKNMDQRCHVENRATGTPTWLRCLSMQTELEPQVFWSRISWSSVDGHNPWRSGSRLIFWREITAWK